MSKMSKVSILVVMSNMSASILRNVVASVFRIRPESVVLSGEIDPTRSFTGHDCWSSQSNTYSFKLWGFSPVRGFVSLNQDGGCSRNSTSGENYGDEGTQLMYIPGVGEFVFFLVNEDFTSGNGRDYNSYTWTLYKAPDFQKKWAEIEEADTLRWVEWINS